MWWDDSCACPRCVQPRKRRRAPRPPIVALGAAQTSQAGGAERAGSGAAEHAADEPLFVLERLAHIRCALLTLTAPIGMPHIVGAAVRVSGSIVTARCELAPSTEDASTATEPRGPLALRLDVGEPLGDAGGASVRTDGGFAYVRLPLGSAPRPGSAGAAGALPGSAGGASASPFDPAQLSPREESGLCRRAALQRRRERRELPGAALRCRRCGAGWLCAPARVLSMPDVDAASMVDFAQCCQEIDFDWDCVFPRAEAGGGGEGNGHDGPGRLGGGGAVGGGDDATRPAGGVSAVHGRAPQLYGAHQACAENVDGSAPGQSRADQGGGSPTPAVCFVSDHALHFAVAPPPGLMLCGSGGDGADVGWGSGKADCGFGSEWDSLGLGWGIGGCASDASAEGNVPFWAPLHVHASAFGGEARDVWVPLRCAGCGEVVGAAATGRREAWVGVGGAGREGGGRGVWSVSGCGGGGEPEGCPQPEAGGGVFDGPCAVSESVASAAVAPAGEAPLWFEERVPAKCGTVLQLLKAAVTVGPSSPDRQPAGAAAWGGAAGRGGETAAEHACLGTVSPPLFDDFSLGTLLAWRMLREALDANDDAAGAAAGGPGAPVHFALCDSSAGAPVLLLTLLSPYVTVHTNQQALGAPGGGWAHGRRGGGGGGGGQSRAAQDALKVLFCEAGGKTASEALGRWHAQRSVRLLWLNRRGCAAACEQLRDSVRLIPPRSRRLGAFQLAYLPVAPTWD